MSLQKAISILNKDFFNFSYIFNFFLPSYIFLITYIVGYKSLSAEYSVILSFNQLILFSISGHLRNYFLSDLKNNNDKNILFRIIISLIFIIFQFYTISILHLSFKEIYYYYIFIIAINTAWIYEIVISSFEKNFQNFKYLFYFEVILLLIHFFCVFIDYKISLFILLFIILKKLIFTFFLIFKIDKNLILENKKENSVFKYLFLSTFFITLSSFLIRIIITKNFDIEVSANFIFCFAIGSLLSTLYVNSLGINLVTKKRFYPYYFKLLISFYILSFFISLLFMFLKNIPIDYSLLLIWVPTSIGALVLFKAQEKRLKFFVEKYFLKKILTKDIILSILQIILCYLIVIYLKNYFSYFFLISSVLSFIVYFFFNYEKIRK